MALVQQNQLVEQLGTGAGHVSCHVCPRPSGGGAMSTEGAACLRALMRIPVKDVSCRGLQFREQMASQSAERRRGGRGWMRRDAPVGPKTGRDHVEGGERAGGVGVFRCAVDQLGQRLRRASGAYWGLVQSIS